MSTIILDTSVLVPDYWMRSAMIRSTIRAVRRLRDTIYLPQLVIDETVNKFREELQNSTDQFARAEDRLGRVLAKRMRQRKIDVSERTLAYQEWLKAEIKRKSIHVIPYTSEGHETVVRRALLRRKPFCAEGQRGYRDAILWQAVLDWGRVARDEILFVSRNTKDFADPNNDEALHPHLVRDLEAIENTRLSVHYFSGLEHLLSRSISPRLKLLPSLESEVRSGKLGRKNLREWLVAYLPAEANRTLPSKIEYRSPRMRPGDWVVGKIHDVDRLVLISTSDLTDKSILVLLSVVFSVDIVPRQPMLGLDPLTDYGIDNPSRGIAVVAAEVNANSHEILSSELEYISLLETRQKHGPAPGEAAA